MLATSVQLAAQSTPDVPGWIYMLVTLAVGGAGTRYYFARVEKRLKSAEQPTALYEEFLALVEPAFLEAALVKHHGQCAAAARALGIHRTTLRKKIDQYGIAGDD